jgi:chaperonin cofactor prefoldin
MSESTTFQPDDAEPADLKAAVEEYIKKIDRIREQMESDQREIDLLKSETREILARLKAA